VAVPTYIALLHTPMVNRKGAVVTTSVTNLDIHDLSRSAKTFGIRGYFVVTPIEDQHELMQRILGHWSSESSKQHHPDRVAALSLVQMARSFEEVKESIRAAHGDYPEVVLTDARPIPNSISYSAYRRELENPGRDHKPALLVFGTGWGISDAFYPEVHRILAPIYGSGGVEGYNHLSVRAAVAIILDRLFGQ
jgi:hypothetical protein